MEYWLTLKEMVENVGMKCLEILQEQYCISDLLKKNRISVELFCGIHVAKSMVLNCSSHDPSPLVMPSKADGCCNPTTSGSHTLPIPLSEMNLMASNIVVMFLIYTPVTRQCFLI